MSCPYLPDPGLMSLPDVAAGLARLAACLSGWDSLTCFSWDQLGLEQVLGEASLCVGYVNVIALIFMSLFLAKLIILP